MKNRIKRINCFLVVFLICFTSFLGKGESVSAANTKSKVYYPSAIQTAVNMEGGIQLLGCYLASEFAHPTRYSLVKLSTSSKHLKARYYEMDKKYGNSVIYVYARKEGTYSVTIKIKITKTGKIETIKIPVYVRDSVPIQKISIADRQLKAMGDDRYFSEKSSGKIQVTMNPDYELTRISVLGTDEDTQFLDSGIVLPEYNFGGLEEIVQNGQKIYLNYKARGKTYRIDIREDSESFSDYYSPHNRSEEEFDFPVAVTSVAIFYHERHSDEEESIYLRVYTPAKKPAKHK